MLTLPERLAQLRAAPRFFTLAIPALCVAYCAALLALGGLTALHLLFCAAALALSLFSDATRRLCRIVLPFILFGAVYDSMRWYADYIRSPVIHIREPYAFDLRFFGVHTAGGVVTPNEYWQRHTSSLLDFFCGLSYTPFFFIGETAALALWLFFHGQQRRSERLVWVFVIANFVGFSIYYIYPAAPPWYVADHGFVADLGVHASPAGAIRFDQLIGIPVMQTFYGKSADVFGAIPSLHVVYPFLAMNYGFKLPRFRWIGVFYWLLVCFAAVYLNHHYLLDVFVGLSLALCVMAAFRLLFGPVEVTASSPAREEPARTAPVAER